MKFVGKIFSLLLALVMVLSLPITVFAEEPGTPAGNTITVKNAKKDETYRIYRMLDLAVHENPDEEAADPYDGFYYSYNAKWKDFWTTGSGKQYIVENRVGDIIVIAWKQNYNSTGAMQSFGKLAKAWAAEHEIEAEGETTPEEDGNISFTGLENGYYLITSTYGTLAMVDSTPSNTEQNIVEKNQENTLVELLVQESAEHNGSPDSYGTENDAQIGDSVQYKATIKIDRNSTNVVYHGNVSDALTLSNSIYVYRYDYAVSSSYYSVQISEDGKSFTIAFQDAYLYALDGERTIRYSATLNNQAVVGTPATSEGVLTWGDASSTQTLRTETYTHSFQIQKYDGMYGEDHFLAGAEFYLGRKDYSYSTLAVSPDGRTYRFFDYNQALPEGYTRTSRIKTLSDSVITIEGADSDDYWLEEYSAPAGYNKLENRVEVAVSEENNTVVKIENLCGTELPVTGGVGTTIFYVLGAILVVGAAVLLIVKKRMEMRG